MSKKIENPACSEVQDVIQILNAQNVCLIEIYSQPITMYVEGVMSNLRQWCWMFNKGRTNVRDRSGHPSPNAEDLKNRIDKHIRANRSFTLDNIHEIFPQISRSWLMKLLQNISATKEFVPDGCHILVEEHKSKCMGATLMF